MICRECGNEDFAQIDQSHSLSLYQHVDEKYQCTECGHIDTYGKAANPERGFAFYLPERKLGAKLPECPEHGCSMMPTKAWVDQPAGETIQFKCMKMTDNGQYCQWTKSVTPRHPSEL